jgi:hypothetical protein
MKEWGFLDNPGDRFYVRWHNAKSDYYLRYVRLPVCPSVRMYERSSHWKDFRQISYQKLLRKNCRENLNLVIIGQKYRELHMKTYVSFILVGYITPPKRNGSLPSKILSVCSESRGVMNISPTRHTVKLYVHILPILLASKKVF